MISFKRTESDLIIEVIHYFHSNMYQYTNGYTHFEVCKLTYSYPTLLWDYYSK